MPVAVQAWSRVTAHDLQADNAADVFPEGTKAGDIVDASCFSFPEEVVVAKWPQREDDFDDDGNPTDRRPERCPGCGANVREYEPHKLVECPHRYLRVGRLS